MLLKILFLILALTILIPAPFLQAQATSPNTPAATIEYTLGPGDVLGITVVDVAELSVPQVSVMADGTISLPPLPDSVSVAGKTITEAKEMLTAMLKRFVINPMVNITLIQRHVPHLLMAIGVMGEVAKPGSFAYRDEMHVLDALILAGGVLETADLNEATLIHNGKEQKLDLDAILRHRQLSGDIKLTPGDRIMIPKLHDRIYVFGAVSRPGYYMLKPGDRILDALKGCGGPLSNADLHKITHIRMNKKTNRPVSTTVDIIRFSKTGDTTQNLLLEPGDVLYIPLHAESKKGGVQLAEGAGKTGTHVLIPCSFNPSCCLPKTETPAPPAGGKAEDNESVAVNSPPEKAQNRAPW